MDSDRYREALERSSLVKDLEFLPFGDLIFYLTKKKKHIIKFFGD